MHIRATKTNPNQTTDALRCQVIEQVIEHAISSGVPEGEAAKLINALHGPDAPCKIRFPELHIAHVNSLADQSEVLLDRIAGQYTYDRPDGSTTIRLNEEGEQHLFLLMIRRQGQVPLDWKPTPGERFPTFWAPHLIVLPVEGDMPLVLSLDLNSDGAALQMQWSRRIYFRNRPLPNGQWLQTNRLRTLNELDNLPGLLLVFAQMAGFPLEETRVNRAPRQERFAGVAAGPRRMPSLVQSPYAAATSARPGPEETGDFADPFNE